MAFESITLSTYESKILTVLRDCWVFCLSDLCDELAKHLDITEDNVDELVIGMQKLCEHGFVTKESEDCYMITDYGRAVLEALAQIPAKISPATAA